MHLRSLAALAVLAIASVAVAAEPTEADRVRKDIEEVEQDITAAQARIAAMRAKIAGLRQRLVEISPPKDPLSSAGLAKAIASLPEEKRPNTEPNGGPERAATNAWMKENVVGQRLTLEGKAFNVNVVGTQEPFTVFVSCVAPPLPPVEIARRKWPMTVGVGGPGRPAPRSPYLSRLERATRGVPDVPKGTPPECMLFTVYYPDCTSDVAKAKRLLVGRSLAVSLTINDVGVLPPFGVDESWRFHVTAAQTEKDEVVELPAK